MAFGAGLSLMINLNGIALEQHGCGIHALKPGRGHESPVTAAPRNAGTPPPGSAAARRASAMGFYLEYEITFEV